MFIPLHDANSLKHIKLQYVTFGLIAANVADLRCSPALGRERGRPRPRSTASASSRRSPSTCVELPPELVLVPEDLTYLTYAFLHGDFFHLGGNMLFLWVFGDNVEDALGHFRFLVFYLLCAVAGACAARLDRARTRRRR